MKTIRPLLIFLTFFLIACAPTTSTNTPTSRPSPATVTPVSITPITIPTLTPTSTKVPNAAESQHTSPIDGMPLVFVPAGTVRMGGLDVHADDRDELPAHTVSLDAFWIDKFEVTNAMYMLCVQSGECAPPHGWVSGKRSSYFNNEEFKDYPVVNVKWEQADTYCSWVNRRLPTEAEWERAARGDDFRNYPWGDEPPNEGHANFNRILDDTSRVGSYHAGASPFGAMDMAGNVWEWVADLYEIAYYKVSPEHNPTGPETNTTYLRVIRGGSFQDGGVNLRVSKRGAALGPNPSAPFDAPDREGEHSSKIGFRCATGD